MSAETDIAAIDDGGVNTALEVRTALTSLLTPAWHRTLYARSGTPHTDDDEFDDGSLSGTAVTPTGTVTWAEGGGLLSALFEDVQPSDMASRLWAMTPSTSPVTIETASRLLGSNQTSVFPMSGLVITDGTTTTSNAVAFFRYYESTKQTHVYEARSGTLTAMSTIEYTGLLYNQASPSYLRLIWSAANTFKVQFSLNGVQWMDDNVGSFAHTITPTHYGVFVSNWATATQESMADFEYFRVTESDLYV